MDRKEDLTIYQNAKEFGGYDKEPIKAINDYQPVIPDLTKPEYVNPPKSG